MDAQAGVVPGANENHREGLVAGLLRRHGRRSAGLQAAEADALPSQRTVGVDATGGAEPLAAVPYDATENGDRAPPPSTMALPDTEVLPEATGEAAVILGTLRMAAAGKGPRPRVATPETGDATPPSEPSRLHQTGAGISAAAAPKSKNGVEETRGRLEHETEAQHSADEGGDTGGARRAPSSASAADPAQAQTREPDARWRPDELERRLQAEVQVLMAVEESASCRGQTARWFSAWLLHFFLILPPCFSLFAFFLQLQQLSSIDMGHSITQAQQESVALAQVRPSVQDGRVRLITPVFCATHFYLPI